MRVSTKSIQYIYQVGYGSQLPAQYKSQAHNLPVLSAPQPTPTDQLQLQSQYLPNNDSRFAYAAPEIAAPFNQIDYSAAPVATESSIVAASPQAGNVAPAPVAYDAQSLAAFTYQPQPLETDLQAMPYQLFQLPVNQMQQPEMPVPTPLPVTDNATNLTAQTANAAETEASRLAIGNQLTREEMRAYEMVSNPGLFELGKVLDVRM